METSFDRAEHVYDQGDFEEIMKDMIRFFNGTPVIGIPPITRFDGAGVYALYYIGNNGLYNKLSGANRTSFSVPIYVGKAVPKGWRQARVEQVEGRKTYELHRRIKEHTRSVDQVNDLHVKDFKCRFTILEKNATDLIGALEAALIRYYKPLWNVCIDGFGNHDPGKGRYNQAKSSWDVLHRGRAWADRCTGVHADRKNIERDIIDFFSKNADS